MTTLESEIYKPLNLFVLNIQRVCRVQINITLLKTCNKTALGWTDRRAFPSFRLCLLRAATAADF
jgi:hypothetical protein